jgi:hypothetical protein
MEENFFRSLPFFLHMLEFPDPLAEGLHFFDESPFFFVSVSHLGILTSKLHLNYISLSLEGLNLARFQRPEEAPLHQPSASRLGLSTGHRIFP